MRGFKPTLTSLITAMQGMVREVEMSFQLLSYLTGLVLSEGKDSTQVNSRRVNTYYFFPYFDFSFSYSHSRQGYFNINQVAY